MKKNFIKFLFLCLAFSGNAQSQGLHGVTLNGNPHPSNGNLLFPVISPTCEYDQFTFQQLLNVAFSGPSTFNSGIVALGLVNQGFSESAARNFLVTVLCNA